MIKRVILIAMLGAALPAIAIERTTTVTVEADTVSARAGAGAGAKCLGPKDGCKPGCAVMLAGGGQVFVVAGGEGGVNTSVKCRVLTRVTDSVDENRGWLGVALGEFHEKRSDGDAVEETQGVTVMNVVKDSPAEAAGLLEDDMIVSLNGVAVESVKDLSKAIGDLGPGAVANLEIERDGNPITVSVTLGSPQAGNVEWLYAPDVSFTEQYNVLPHILRLPPGGGVQSLNLDDLDGSMSIIAKVLGSMDDATTEISFDDGERTLRIHVDRDGELLDIEQRSDGPVVVTRTVDGKATENEYENTEALEEADPDALELLNQYQPNAIWIGKDGHGAIDLNLSFGSDGNMAADAIRKRIQFQLEGMEDIGKRIAEVTATIEGLDDLNMDIGKVGMPQTPTQKTKAIRSFKVNPDGQIELTIRKGDTEIVKVFQDEADLEAREPNAYDRYREVMDADIER